MTDNFEVRHRALREQWMNVSDDDYRFDSADEAALAEFDRATGALVDDLVAAVREEQRWEDMLAAERGAQMRGHLLGQLIDARRVRRAALAALDEASR